MVRFHFKLLAIGQALPALFFIAGCFSYNKPNQDRTFRIDDSRISSLPKRIQVIGNGAKILLPLDSGYCLISAIDGSLQAYFELDHPFNIDSITRLINEHYESQSNEILSMDFEQLEYLYIDEDCKRIFALFSAKGLVRHSDSSLMLYPLYNLIILDNKNSVIFQKYSIGFPFTFSLGIISECDKNVIYAFKELEQVKGIYLPKLFRLGYQPKSNSYIELDKIDIPTNIENRGYQIDGLQKYLNSGFTFSTNPIIVNYKESCFVSNERDVFKFNDKKLMPLNVSLLYDTANAHIVNIDLLDMHNLLVQIRFRKNERNEEERDSVFRVNTISGEIIGKRALTNSIRYDGSRTYIFAVMRNSFGILLETEDGIEYKRYEIH